MFPDIPAGIHNDHHTERLLYSKLRQLNSVDEGDTSLQAGQNNIPAVLGKSTVPEEVQVFLPHCHGRGGKDSFASENSSFSEDF